MASIKTLKVLKSEGASRTWGYKDKNENDDEGFLCLTALTKLRELSLSKYLLMRGMHTTSPTGAVAFSALKKLVKLELRNRPIHTGANSLGTQGVAHLSGLAELEYLDLDFNNIGNQGMAHLSQLSSLKQLTLSIAVVDAGRDGITDEGLCYITGLQTLTKVDLSNIADHHQTGNKESESNCVGATGAMHLSKLANLKSLDLCADWGDSNRGAIGD